MAINDLNIYDYFAEYKFIAKINPKWKKRAHFSA
jgi:hypothetical protein